MTFKEWLKRDFIYIVLILFALFACIYTVGHVQDYMNDCNEHWAEQFEKNCEYIDPYAEFNDVPMFNISVPGVG